MRAGYSSRGFAVLLAFLIASGPFRARGESLLFPDVYSELAQSTGPKVVVLAVSLDKEADKRLGLLEGLGERATDAAGRYELEPLAFALDPDVTKARQQAQAKADQALRDGQKALDDLDALKALKLFDEAVAESKAGEPATKRGFETYVLAGVMRAAAMVANGDNDAAKAEINKILVYAPKAQFPDTHFPPELIKYAEVQRKVVQKATGTVIVRSEPSGAKVTIDGIFRGYAPVSATGFAPGQHLAVAQLGGYQTIAGEIPVDDQTVRLKPAEANSRLQLARDKVKKDPDGPGRDSAARDFGRLLSADQVLLLVGRASLTPGKLELTAERIDVKDGHNYGFRSGPVEPSPEPLQGFIGAVLLNDEPRSGSSPVTHFGSGGGKGGSGRTILAFSLWGLAVVGLGTGIFAGVEASDRAAQYKKTLQVQTIAAANIASEGKTYALIADISYAVAILAAAAGTFFFLTRSKSGSSSSSASTAEAPPPEKKTDKPVETARPPPEDAKKADEKKKADEQRKADEAKKAEDQKKADEAKKAEEEKKDTRTEKQKKADEKKRLAEEKKKAEEEKKEEERRKKEEAKEEKRRKEEEAKEEKRKAEEQRKADEKKKADADAKKAEEQKKADEAKKTDDAKKSDEQKKADEKKKADDDAKAAEEQRKADEAKKAQQQNEAKKAEEPKKTEEQKGDAAQKAEELRRQQEAEKKKKEEQRKKQQQDDEDLRNQ